MTDRIETGHPPGTTRPKGFRVGRRYDLALLILLAIVCGRAGKQLAVSGSRSEGSSIHEDLKVKELECPPHIDFRAEVADPDKKARTYSKMYRGPYQWRVAGDYIVFSCDNSTHPTRREEKDA